MNQLILIEGLEARALAERVASYQTLGPMGPERAEILIGAIPNTGWTQIVVPDAVERWHYHSLALWLQGRSEEPAPSRTILISRSETPNLSYILHVDESTVLQGHQADGTPLRVDVPSAVVERGGQVAPAFVPPRALLAARGLPLSVLDAPPARGLRVAVALPPLGETYNPELREGTPPAPTAWPQPRPSLWQRLFGG